MIDPITGAALIDAMTSLTGEMTGLTLAEAWEQQGFKDPAEAGYGLDFGVNAGILGKDKPAISGDTTNSISASQESDPIDAFEAWETANPGSVDATTGGIVDGSNTGAFPYSLLQTLDEDTQVEVIKAVATVAVPIEQAYTAIAQALGVSMNAAEMDVETKQKFAQSIIDGGDLIYDAAAGLVKAWWDGVHILFPKKTVESVSNMLESEGIGGGDIGTGSGTSGGVSYTVDLATTATNRNGMTASVSGGYLFGTSGNAGSVASVVRGIGLAGMTATGIGGIAGPYTNSYGVKYYLTNSSLFNVVSPSLTISYVARSGQSSGAYIELANVLFGPNSSIRFGEFPEGTESSKAEKYDLSNIPEAGGIATSSGSVIPAVPINLPVDPLNTIDSEVDPITTPTTPEQEKNLPAPPIPLPIPDTNVSNPDVPFVDSSVVDSTLVDELVEELANTLDPQAPQSSGIIPFPPLPSIGGQYPSIIPASGSGLIHVYNPTPAEMVSFGNWLWVTYADATIDKIWNNPFDGIIGAFELYSTPQTDGTDNIRSGFLTCPTTAKLVRQRYTEIDCGTVIVPEFYGNYLDYSPYSQAYIYLPFIGINEVSIDDIVGHAINIRYRIDAYNGSCIAMIYVAKNGYRNLCYQFAGNCAVEVPLAGGSQAAIKAGVLQAEAYARASLANAAISAASQIGAGIASGSVAGIVMGALGGLGTAAAGAYGASQSKQAARVANKSTVQHSGQFGASHGAMGLKIPHIIIRNPIQVKVVNYNEDYGFPAHKRVIVGGCRGYLRVREVNVISAHATDDEKALIEALLKNGVYVS